MAEHIINLAFNIDDADIINKVENLATDKITNEIIRELKKTIGVASYSNFSESMHWEEYVASIVNDFLNENKEVIIKGAITSLADKLSRTKLAKEMLKGICEDE